MTTDPAHGAQRVIPRLLVVSFAVGLTCGLFEGVSIGHEAAAPLMFLWAFCAQSVALTMLALSAVTLLGGLPLMRLLAPRWPRLATGATIAFPLAVYLVAAAGIAIFDAGGLRHVATLLRFVWPNAVAAMIAALIAVALVRASATTRRVLVAVVAVFVACGLGIGAFGDYDPRESSGMDLPNIVLMVSDTLRADRMSVYGYDRPTTPFLERFAAQRAMVHERAYVSYSFSTSSHATIQTGCMAATHRALKNGGQLPADNLTLAERLQAGGYLTAAFHDHHLLSQTKGFSQGYSTFVETHNPDLRRTRPIVWRRELTVVRAYDLLRRDEVHTVTDLAEDWLRDAPEPFFLWVVLAQPHTSYHSPARFTNSFVDPSYSGPMDGTLETVRKLGGLEALDAADIQRMGDLYDAEVRWVDDSVERLVSVLEARGVLDRTVVTVTSDHGEALGEHGQIAEHGLVFEESIRVPLIMSGPGVPVGRSAESVGVIDVPATLIHLTVDPSVAGFCEGTDLSGTWTGSRHRPVLAFRKRLIAAMDEQWKLIMSAYPAGLEDFYNLEKDPHELTPGPSPSVEVHDRLRGAIDEYCRASEANWKYCSKSKDTDMDTTGMSEEEIQLLRSMGYVE